jgi:hypothetical protein
MHGGGFVSGQCRVRFGFVSGSILEISGLFSAFLGFVSRLFARLQMTRPNFARLIFNFQPPQPGGRASPADENEHDQDPGGIGTVCWHRCGKRELAIALIGGPADKDGEVTTRAFGTTVPELEKPKRWLIRESCTSVAMECKGSYWIPVKNILENSVRITLVCARKHKPERGDKTDFPRRQESGPSAPARTFERKLSAGSKHCRVTRSDPEKKEAVEQSAGGEKPDTEGAGDSQR